MARDEPARYYELAGKDAVASPRPPRNAWAVESGAVMQARPILPRTPATAVAGHGHTMFRMLLEDLSGTRIDDEDGRLTLLATLDHTPAVYQRAGARSLADGGRADLRQDHPTARLHRR